MKKMTEKVLAGVLAVSALAGSMVTSVAQADVGATVGASNMYYWRGQDLGNGDAAIWGDLKLSSDVGVYGGAWMSSGDVVNGTEYDLYIGYGTKFGDFGVDLSYWNYVYPSRKEIAIEPSVAVDPENPDAEVNLDDPITFGDLLGGRLGVADVTTDAPIEIGDLAEIVLALSYGPVALTYYDNAEGAED